MKKDKLEQWIYITLGAVGVSASMVLASAAIVHSDTFVGLLSGVSFICGAWWFKQSVY